MALRLGIIGRRRSVTNRRRIGVPTTSNTSSRIRGSDCRRHNGRCDLAWECGSVALLSFLVSCYCAAGCCCCCLGCWQWVSMTTVLYIVAVVSSGRSHRNYLYCIIYRQRYYTITSEATKIR